MGQLKKIVPRPARDKIVDIFERVLPENSFRRNQFANSISVGGAVLVAAGAAVDAKGHKRIGMALRGVGETADDFDGDASRRLGTDGRTGALVDSVLDKFKVMVEVGVLWGHARNMTSPESEIRKKRLSIIAGKHAANAAINIYATARGAEVESSQAGKINMWMDGLAIGFWGISDASESQAIKSTTNALGNVAFAAGVATGAVSMFGYAEQALQARDQSRVAQQFIDTSDLSFHHL